MNMLDKKVLAAIRQQEPEWESGNKAVDGFVRELKGMRFPQLARLYLRAKRDWSIRLYVAAELWQRLKVIGECEATKGFSMLIL